MLGSNTQRNVDSPNDHTPSHQVLLDCE